MLRSEDQLLTIIDRHFERSPSNLLLGRGDDCAELPALGPLALSTDLFLEDAHFRRSYFTPEEIGHKALAVNLSDLAAAGAKPAGFSLGLVCTPDLDEAWYDRMFSGMASLAARYGLPLSGGDISLGQKLGFSITVWGTFAGGDSSSAYYQGLGAIHSNKADDCQTKARRSPADFGGCAQSGPYLETSTLNSHPAAKLSSGFLRRRAAPGEKIFIIGPAGDYCALGLARNGLLQLEKRGRAAMGDYPDSTRALLLPEPQIEAGLALSRLSAELVAQVGLMDLSDGLLRDLPRLLGQHGAELDLTAAILHPELSVSLGDAPIKGQAKSPTALESCHQSCEDGLSGPSGEAYGAQPKRDSAHNAIRLALTGGDDYLLLGSAPSNFLQALKAKLPQSSRLDIIGTALEAEGVRLRGKTLEEITGAAGFDHFSGI